MNSENKLTAVRSPIGDHWREPNRNLDVSYSNICERLEYLLRNPISRNISLLAVPSFWVRISTDKQDFAIARGRYVSTGISMGPPDVELFDILFGVSTSPTRIISLTFKNGQFQQKSISSYSSNDQKKRMVKLQPQPSPSMILCLDEWNMDPFFEVTLFYSKNSVLRVNIVDSSPKENYLEARHPMENFSYYPKPQRFFQFQIMNPVTHYTDRDPTIDASITLGLCDACGTKPITAECGHGCGTTFYCGQKCADSHTSQHKCK